jgi:predicted nucleotidyltransferase
MMKDRLFDLIRQLSIKGVRFVICGGVACVLQGVERATYDLDLSLSMDDTNLKKLVAVLKKFDMQPRIPEPVERLYDPDSRERWIKEKNALVYTFVSPDNPLQVDIFLQELRPFDELLENADVITIDDIDVRVASKRDLLALKRMVQPLRTKDRIDIEELEKLLHEDS